jgi:hypothetical protein
MRASALNFPLPPHDRAVSVIPVIQKPRHPNNGGGADIRFSGDLPIGNVLYQHLRDTPSIDQPLQLGRGAEVVKETAHLLEPVELQDGFIKILFMRLVDLRALQVGSCFANCDSDLIR